MTHSSHELSLSTIAAAVGDRYEVEREIGRGGMATVYLARDVRHDRNVALKILHPELFSSVGAERFQREISICARLTHPNILPLHDSGEANGILFYVMPFIEGESLRQLLERERELAVEHAVSLCREVIDALGYAHTQGFVHRDVKPENILIAGGHAVVSDFGIARITGANSSGGITQSGLVVGSPTYMSPEQGAGDTKVDGRSDLYSVGCVLYEMLVGVPPYSGPNALRLLARHSVDPVPSARALRGDLSPAMDAVISRAMAKNPDDRFPSARAFRLSLDSAMASVTTSTRDAHPALTPSQPVAPGAVSGSVAVFPFADQSAARDQEYLCDGLADDLRSALSRVRALRVASRNSSLAYKGRTVPIQQIGKELGVAAVLDGTVQRSGHRLRVSMYLSSTSDGFQLWSERYERDADDIFALQDEIAQSVVDALRVTLGGVKEQPHLVPRMTNSVEAYQLYLRGRNFWGRREEGGLQKAVDCFRQALEVDPLYVMPYIGLSDAFNTFGAYEYLPPSETFPRVFAAAERALNLDPTLAEAHTALGSARAHYSWDWKAAEENFAEAIALNPQYALAHAYYALMLAATGRFERARDAISRAQQLDPLSQILNALVGWVAFYARRTEDAIRQYRLTIEMEPTFPVAHSFLGFAYLAQGKHEEALAEFLAIPDYRTALGGLGNAFAKCGRADDARGVLTKMERLAATTYVSSFSRAMVHIGLGERDLALTALERACDERGYTMSYVAVAPIVDDLRSEPRFAAILKRMGLAEVPGALTTG